MQHFKNLYRKQNGKTQVTKLNVIVMEIKLIANFRIDDKIKIYRR